MTRKNIELFYFFKYIWGLGKKLNQSSSFEEKNEYFVWWQEANGFGFPDLGLVDSAYILTVGMKLFKLTFEISSIELCKCVILVNLWQSQVITCYEMKVDVVLPNVSGMKR